MRRKEISDFGQTCAIRYTIWNIGKNTGLKSGLLIDSAIEICCIVKFTSTESQQNIDVPSAVPSNY